MWVIESFTGRIRLKRVELGISDACMVLVKSVAEFYPDAAWQRCVLHLYRNIFSHAPSTKVREVAAMLKAIRGAGDAAAARVGARRSGAPGRRS